ncbi:MAG: hypothetical protein QOJ15_9125, partial [Bradyrhizobium sp.]|nr:hypothetical protein [Bradyrhizobium sp.]
MSSDPCRAADPVKGEASFSASGGYARLVLKLADDVESEVATAGSIVIIRFKRPVDIPIDKLAEAVPDYVNAVRRDPDGSAIRLSLARRVTINTMTAGERVFIDLLPDSWSGQPPSLPQEVIRELAERARAAERALRLQRASAEVKKRPPIRVRASVQPTFVRFVFEMPDGVGVSSVLNDQKLTLLFNTALNFDLADAKVAAPANIASINQKTEGDISAVEIALLGNVDVHSFREDKNYIIDVAFQQVEAPSVLATPAATAPAASEKHADAASPSRHPGEIVPPTSEMIAEQANIEINPEAAAKLPPVPEAPKPEAAPKEMPAPAAEAPPKINLSASEPPPAAKPPQAVNAPQAVNSLSAVKPPAVNSPPAAAAADSAASVSARRDSDGLRLMFDFAAPTPAALFRRADTVWLVFDSKSPIDIEPIRSKGGSIISDVSRLPLDNGQAIRIRLNRPQMPSLIAEDQPGSPNWTVTFADTMQTPTQPLAAFRNIADPAHANVTVALSKPGLLHRLVDPDAGDTIMVVTAPAPVRGFIKRQDFVEFSLLESIHGVAVRPNSDDVTAEVTKDKIVLGKPGGLTLSSAVAGSERAPAATRPIFDIMEWRKNQEANFAAREDELIAAAAAFEADQRAPARIDLARFYLARQMYPEAKAVLDLVLADAKPGLDDPVALIVHAVANSLMGRPEQAMKDLNNPAIGADYDSQLWKGLAYARQGKCAEAREKFKNVEFAITALPIDLQRIVIADAMRCSLEVRDFSGAAKRSSDLDVIG